MSESQNFADAAARTHTLAAALALGRSIDRWSLVLVAVTLAGLLWAPLPLFSRLCLLASLLAGCAQKIYALRVAFDASLFRHWSESWAVAATQKRDPATLAADLAAFDQTLAACGLRASSGNAARGLDSRLLGARKLLGRQALALAIQFAVVVVALAAIRLLPPG